MLKPLSVRLRFLTGVFLAACAIQCLTAAFAQAAPTLVQHANKNAGTTLSSSLPFPSSNTAGNWIGVLIRAGHSGQALAVSDSRGNTYRQAVLFNQTVDPPVGDTMAIYYAENISGGANTVTVSESISGSTLRFAIFEYSGLATTGSFDATSVATAQGGGTAASSGNATTAAGNLVLGLVMTGEEATYMAGSGFTIRESVPVAPNTKFIVEDRIQPATGTVAASATFTPSNSWGAVVAAFLPATGGSTPPGITGLSPTSGPVGAQVIITGTNFGPSQGSSTVTFNGTPTAPASAWSPTSITVGVPAIAAGSASVVVTVGGAASNAMTFTVTAPPAPSITNLNPPSGPAGTQVIINGSNFGASQGSSTVTFGGTPTAPASAWSPTSITVLVPAVAAGSTTVVITVAGVPSNGIAFTVTAVPAGLSLVQHANKIAGTTLSSSMPFPSNNTAGNWIGVMVRAGSSGQVFSVQDTRGNTYRSAIQFNQTTDPPKGDTVAIFYAENIAGGANTVTVSDSISGSTLRFAIFEYSGVAASGSLDATSTAAAQGNGVLASSGNTATAAGNLVLGLVMTGEEATYAPGGGFTIEESIPVAPNTKFIVEDRVQTVSGPIAASATFAPSNFWGAVVAAFKPAVGSGGTSPNITNLNPTSGSVGTQVTISGTNFGASQGSSTVTFKGTATTPASTWSTTSITILVPAISVGSATVVVNVGGVASNGATFAVTVPPPISVAITPAHGGLTLARTASLTAAVQNDSSNSGVTWSVSGGSLSNQTISAANFSASTPGVYTIVATSISDTTKSAAAVLGVTDLTGVNTWRNDASRSGINTKEYALTTQNVASATFGRLFSCPVDGWIFAQPLWAANVAIGGTPHNVVYVATENDSLYAVDADGPGCKPVWSTLNVRLVPAGEIVSPFADLQNDNALGPVVGITGTPVIDPTTQTIYLVALTKNSTTGTIIQRLHAIDITTGLERPNSPKIISASITGTGYDNSSGNIAFAPNFQKQRPALLLLNGVVYISWAGFLDTDFYHGWLMGYDAATLNQVAVFNDTRDGGRGGIWMSGGGAAADSSGNIYLLSGNGDFNANNTGGRNYGDTFLKLSTAGGLSVADWFTPFDQLNLAGNDLDLGGGGAVIVIDQPTGPFPHLVLGGGKAGKLYVVSRDGFGGFNATDDSQIVQSFVLGNNGIYSAPLFWQNNLFAAASGAPLSAYSFTPSTSLFQTTPFSSSTQSFSFPGATPSLSAAGTGNAILWAIQRVSSTAPVILHAYDPNNLHTELWNSSQAAGNRDQAGIAGKFTVPTVANGKVYIGTQTELDVYGLLPN